MKVNQLKVGALLTYIAQGVNIVVGLVYTPIMLRLLGQNEYGLYQLVASVVAYLSLLNLGFGSSYVRFYSRYKANEQKREISKLNGMFLVIFMIITLITLFLGSIMVLNIEFVFGSGLTASEYSTARILMGFMVFNMSLTFPMSLFNSFITAHEKFIFQKSLTVLQSLLNPFLALPLLILGYGSIGLVVVSTVITVTKFILDLWYCFKKLNMKIVVSGFDIRLLSELWTFTFFIFLTQVINQVNWNVDKFLLGRLSGTSAVAIYAVGNTLRSLYVNFSTATSYVFIPRVNKIVAENKDDFELTKLMTKIGRVQLLILLLILSGFGFFGKTFVLLWAGKGYEDAFWVAFLIMFMGTIPLIQNIGIEIQIAKNKHKMRSVIYSVVAVGNVLISIPLILKYGPLGAAIGTAIALFAGNIIFMNIYYHKSVGLDMKFYWGEVIKILPGLIPSIIVGFLSTYWFEINTWPTIVASIIVYTSVYALSMWIISMNKFEKNLLLSPLRKKFSV